MSTFSKADFPLVLDVFTGSFREINDQNGIVKLVSLYNPSQSRIDRYRKKTFLFESFKNYDKKTVKFVEQLLVIH